MKPKTYRSQKIKLLSPKLFTRTVKDAIRYPDYIERGVIEFYGQKVLVYRNSGSLGGEWAATITFWLDRETHDRWLAGHLETVKAMQKGK